MRAAACVPRRLARGLFLAGILQRAKGFDLQGARSADSAGRADASAPAKGTATGGLGTTTPWQNTTVSGVSGSGTLADPWTVKVEGDALPVGLHLDMDEWRDDDFSADVPQGQVDVSGSDTGSTACFELEVTNLGLLDGTVRGRCQEGRAAARARIR
jgi:hypothetical protein